MSERMTDDMWHGGQHGMTRAMLHAEGTRARASEDEKMLENARLLNEREAMEGQIKALADALEGLHVVVVQDGPCWCNALLRHSTQCDAARAALRLAGRL